ncbi:MAG: class I SAM-dependent methyltransferase [Bdellovibrionaceae bacterium]|nr:class I SAM-dependent methyltransferase [Pseudobdellovibrionaceae bacterium]
MAHKNKENYSPWKARQAGQKPRTRLGVHKKPEKIFSLEEANDRLDDIFRNHGFLGVSHEQRKLLAHYYRLLMLNQQNENFTRLLKFRDIAIKHFIDSLIVERVHPLKFPLMDMGTGPGLPGIPLKIMHPNDQILLAEGVQKRVSFLKSVRDELCLKRLDIIGRNINKFFVYPVQGVITRAVEDIRNTLGNVISCLQVGGEVYFMKGPGVDPEIEPALQSWGKFYELKSDIAYELPKTPHRRRLLVFRKIQNAPLPNEEEQDFPLLEGE